MLPEGRYFIAPGWFRQMENQVWLISAVRGGLDLAGSGVSSITIERDGQNEFEVDLFQAHRAITNLREVHRTGVTRPRAHPLKGPDPRSGQPDHLEALHA